MASDPFKAALTHYRASQTSPRRASSQDWYHSSSRKAKPVHFGKTHAIVQPKTSKQDHGILDNIRSVAGNLGSDVVDTVEGIPGGIVETIHHPIKTAEAIGHDYRNRYGPLFGYLNGGGDIGKFASEIKEHPLAPVLDALTVATAGGGAAAKLGQSARIASRVEAGTAGRAATALHKATSGGFREIAASRTGGKAIKIPLQNNPVKRLRRNLGISFQEKVLPVNTPLIGLKSRALKSAANSKLEKAGQVRYHQRVLTSAVDAMEKVAGGDTKKLDSMANAADYLVSGVDPLKHAATIKKTRLDPLHHEKMRAAGHSEDEIQAAMDHALKPALDTETKKLFDAAQAHYQRQALAKGHQIPEHLLVKADDKLVNSPEVQAIVKVRNAHDAAADHAMTQLVRAGKVTDDEVSKRRVLHVTTVELLGRNAVPVARSSQRVVNMSKGAKSAAERTTRAGAVRATVEGVDHSAARETIEAARKRDLVQPAGNAIKVTADKAHNARVNAKYDAELEKLEDGGGQSVLLSGASAKASTELKSGGTTSAVEKARRKAADEGARLRETQEKARVKEESLPLTPEEVDKAYDKAGLPRPVYNPDTISVGVGRSKADKFGDSAGANYAAGDRIVAPMNVIMRHEWASKITDAQHAHTLLTALGTRIEGELPQNWVWIRDNMPKTIEYTRDLGKSQAETGIATTQKFYEALRSETKPSSGLAVPKQVFDEMTVGRAAMTSARHTTLAKALNIWKWATLATRPGFLTVNVLSNQLMYHLKNGWDFRAFRNAKQAAGAFDEHHSVAGATWGDSERGLSQGGRMKKLKAARDIMYTLTGKHEHALRKYAMYETARKMPQVQRELRALKGGKYDPGDHGGRTMFHEAYNRAIVKHPHIREMVTKNMDDTLGNYRYYTQTEQVLKNLSPFYGWERHSVRNFLRMAEDNPAQMAMLTAVGAQGNAKFLRDFGKGMPDFVHTYVMDSYFNTIAKHLGMGDKVTSYDFGGLNPWKTAVDTGKAVLKGDKKSLLQMAGPAITGPLEEFTGKNPLTGAPAMKTHVSNSILSTIERVIHQTPPVTLAENLTTDKYKHAKMLKKTKGQVLGQYAGAAFKSPDLDLLRKSQARSEAEASGTRKKRKTTFHKRKKTPVAKYGG